MRQLVLAFVILASGCYNPKPQSGSQLCSAAGLCPKGFVCGADNHCYLGQAPSPAPDLAMAADLAFPDDMAACTNGTCAAPTPICDPGSGQCVPCLTDSHCPDGELCQAKLCVAGCSLQHGCGDAGACEADAGLCKVCKMDSDCGDPGSPRCDASSGRCVACLPTNDNCGGNQFCVQSNGVWQCMMGCKMDSDCQPAMDGGTPDAGNAGLVGNFTCCSHVCVDTTADSHNCGKCGVACVNNNSCCGSACADTTREVFNCGKCGASCGGKNASWSCTNSACAITMCNGTFRDCNMDPSDGCEVNIVSDAKNCKACGMACVEANATPICAQSCGIGACNQGFADCDKNPLNGCEVNITNDLANCGSCGKGCGHLNNGTAVCANSQCAVGSCNAGFADCDKNPGNGCEVNKNTDVNNCGACGNRCPSVINGSPGCTNGVCGTSACTAPFLTCGGSPCAINSSSDVNNCSACGTRCPNVTNGTAACKASVCGIGTCVNGFGDCDGNSGNGCEANLNTDVNNCRMCGAKCSAVANGTSACLNGTCGIGACNGTFKDCNNNPGDGCEVDISSDSKNCGGCGKACPNGQFCSNSACYAAVTFSGVFTQSMSSPNQCVDWATFRSQLTGNYSQITIKGSNDPNGVVCQGAAANQLCQALHNNQATSVACGGRTWATGMCGNGIELNAVGPICNCQPNAYVIRPCIGNENWGGVNTNSCSAPTQTITVICQ